MTVTYTLGLDDIVAFNQHFALVRQRELVPRRGVQITIQVVLSCVVILAFIRFGPLGGLLALAAWYAVYFLQTPAFRFLIRKNLTRIYRVGAPDPLVGAHTLVLNDGSFVSQSEQGRSEWPWARLRHVSETPSHVFLYISNTQALILPRRDFSIAHLEDLLRALRAHAPAAFSQPATSNA